MLQFDPYDKSDTEKAVEVARSLGFVCCSGCLSYKEKDDFSPSMHKKKHHYCKRCMEIARKFGHFPKTLDRLGIKYR